MGAMDIPDRRRAADTVGASNVYAPDSRRAWVAGYRVSGDVRVQHADDIRPIYTTSVYPVVKLGVSGMFIGVGPATNASRDTRHYRDRLDHVTLRVESDSHDGQ